jgi:hypothetical protein
MAEYKDIKGFKVQTVSTDPAASAIATGTWASGNPLNTARFGLEAGFGSQTAALLGGGTPPITAATESYNGTSWTEVTDLNTARGYAAGSGSSTAGLLFGGGEPPTYALTESWDGTKLDRSC